MFYVILLVSILLYYFLFYSILLCSSSKVKSTHNKSGKIDLKASFFPPYAFRKLKTNVFDQENPSRVSD